MAWRNYPIGNLKKSKYGANKTVVKAADGVTEIVFDSKKEARRFTELRFLEQCGKISNLKRQVKYILIPAQREPDTVGKRGGVIKGKLLERECSYIADFVYTDNETGEEVVEDAKGMRTPEYVIKRKLMLYVHGIKIKEV